ncbi:hypothetical protein [Hymenobacter sp. B81]|uniref:hypothetical protein n=1 Tax=Hymenobacter sp. B81 TaxID=3344878 RepID=UPI0037DDA505
MVIDLLFGLLVVLGFLPLLTAYCAYSYGRSFWLWFGLGAALPLLSFVLLALLLHRKEMQPGEQLLSEARATLAGAEAEARDFNRAVEALSQAAAMGEARPAAARARPA